MRKNIQRVRSDTSKPKQPGKTRLIFILLFLLFCISNTGRTQNSLTGDGFGGLPGYNPVNYTAGSYSAYTVCGDNRQLYVWGSNNSAQLGNGTITQAGSSIPVAVPGMTEVGFYTAGYITAVIKNNGTVWAWGDGYGEGRGLTHSPAQYLTNVKHVNGGANHILFVKNDGTVWSAGANNDSFFGTGSTNGSQITVPFQMPGINTAVRVAAGGEFPSGFSLILLSDGTVKFTATKAAYINPDQNVSAVTVPTTATGLTNIVDIRANRGAAYALKSDGTVYSWGNNAINALGRPISGSSTAIPGQITFPFAGGGSKIIAISAKDDGVSVLALDDKGNVYGFGTNFWGEIGNEDPLTTPLLVATDAIDIMMGETFSYIAKTGNTLYGAGKSLSLAGGSSSNDNLFMNLPNAALKTFTQIDPTSTSWVNPPMCPVVVVPLKLLDFNVSKQGSSSILKWSTAQEENIRYFVLERSSTGSNFIEISRITAAGNSSTVRNYSYTDAPPSKGSYFYRLKIVEGDGKFTYSAIRLLNFGTKSKILVYPNPVSNTLTVTGLESGATIKVSAADGRIILTQKVNRNTNEINVSKLVPGIYILQLVKDGVLINTQNLRRTKSH